MISSTQTRTGTEANASVPGPGPARARRRGDLAGLLFVAPYLLLLLAFGVGPAVYALSESFRVGPARTLGLDNYTRLLDDFRFWPAVGHVGLFLAIWLPIMVVGVCILALMLHQRSDRFSGAMRFVYYLPGAVSGSASVMLWYFMLEPSLSPFAPVLQRMGFHTTADIFADKYLAGIFALMAFVTGAGSWIVIMYGAFQNISDDIMQAAELDGCNTFQTAVRIKLPLVKNYIVYMIILSFAGGVQLFVEPTLVNSITRVAPSPWWSLNQLGYLFAFQGGDFGASAAISMLLLFFSVVGAWVLITRTDMFETGDS